MAVQLRFATDLRDKAEIARFRREIRTLNYSRSGHDPDNAADPKTDGATLCAWSESHIVGVMDVHWGGEHPLPRERSDALGVGEVANDPKSTVVLDEAVVHPDWHAVGLEMDLKHGAVRYAAYRRARWVFTSCVPQEIASHRGVGFKPNGLPSSNRDHGTRLPVLLDLLDIEGLATLKSPFLPLARQLRATMPDVDEGAPAGPSPDSSRWKELKRVTEGTEKLQVSFLSGLSASTKARLLQDGQYVKPEVGATIVKQGERGRELFLIIRGVVEARKDGKRVAVLGPGEVFGEIGFLLETERTADVVAATGDVVVLKLSHEALTRLMSEQPEVGASLAIGIAHGLCLKLMAHP